MAVSAVHLVLRSSIVYVLALALAKKGLLVPQTDISWLVFRLLALGAAVATVQALVRGQWRKSVDVRASYVLLARGLYREVASCRACIRAASSSAIGFIHGSLAYACPSVSV